jgi:hypothetical protein
MTNEEKKIEEAADVDFPIGKTMPIGSRERYLYEEKKNSFLHGVTHGTKGMYTSKEVEKMCNEAYYRGANDEMQFDGEHSSNEHVTSFNDWFEQNKKEE